MTTTIADDELDLLALWSAISRRRYLLGGLTLLGAVAGFAIGLTIRPVYESREAFQIGRVGGVGFVEEPAKIINQIRQVHRIGDPSLCGSEMPQLNRVEEVVPGLILVAACARTPEESRTFLSKELQKLLSDHQAIFDDLWKLRTEARDAMAAQIDAIEGQDQELEKRVLAAAQQNPAVAAVVIQDRLRVRSELFQLKENVAARELELSSFSTSPPKILSESTSSVPSGRWTRLPLAAVGAVAGLILGVLLAVVLEWRRLQVARP